MLGMLLLAYGLLRAQAVEGWVAVGAGAAAVVVLVGQVTDNRLIFAIAFAMYLVAFGPLGWRILTESDEEWAAQPPEAVPGPSTSRL